MPMARPTMLASARGELKTRSEPNLRCRLWVTLKTPPLPLTSAEARPRGEQSATSSPEDDDARVARHLVVEAGVQEVDHRLRVALRDAARVAKAAEVGSTLGRVDVARGALGVGRRRGEGGVGGGRHLAVDLVAQGAGSSSARGDALLPGASGGRSRGGRAARPPRARRERGRAPRRRRASGSRGGSPARGRGPGPAAARHQAAASRRTDRLARGSQPSTSRTSRLGKERTSFEMLPPAVWTSTGTEIA